MFYEFKDKDADEMTVDMGITPDGQTVWFCIRRDGSKIAKINIQAAVVAVAMPGLYGELKKGAEKK